MRGRYPYLCTFPHHWTVMNGEMIADWPGTNERGARAHSPPRPKIAARPHVLIPFRLPLGA